MRIATLTGVSLATLIAAGPALADLTAEDLWSLNQEIAGRFGATMSADESRTGDSLALSGISIEWLLPFDLGEITIRTDAMTLTELGDGRVSIAYPERLPVDFFLLVGPASERVTITGGMISEVSGQEMIASGTPDRIEIRQTLGRLDWQVTDVDITGVPNMPAIDIGGSGFSEGAATDWLITRENGAITMAFDGTVTASGSEVRIDDGMGTVTEQLTSTGLTESRVQYRIPAQPMNPLNLGDAIRNGLSLDVVSTMADYVSRSTTVLFGETMSKQASRTAITDVSMTFGPDGLRLDLDASDTQGTILMEDLLPMPIEMQADRASFGLNLPLLAGKAAQDVRYAIGLEGLEVNESIWALFDPAGYLPRDPATFVVDLGGSLVLDTDLLNFIALGAVIDGGSSPVILQDLRVNEMRIAAAGATANGAATATYAPDAFDMIGENTPPMPETAQASVTLTGVNGLIDRLIEMGLMSPEDAMGARMGLGMFTTVTGEDENSLEAEIRPDGGIYVNGQRMQ